MFSALWLHTSFQPMDLLGFACILATVFLLAGKDEQATQPPPMRSQLCRLRQRSRKTIFLKQEKSIPHRGCSFLLHCGTAGSFGRKLIPRTVPRRRSRRIHCRALQGACRSSTFPPRRSSCPRPGTPGPPGPGPAATSFNTKRAVRFILKTSFVLHKGNAPLAFQYTGFTWKIQSLFQIFPAGASISPSWARSPASTVRVRDEVDTHGRVFKTDAVHLLVVGQGSVHIVGLKGQVELVLSQVIGLGMALEPGQLQQVLPQSVSQKDNGEVLCLLPADLLQARA